LLTSLSWKTVAVVCAVQTSRVNWDKMAADRRRQFANSNCYRLLCVSWALAQIFCLNFYWAKNRLLFVDRFAEADWWAWRPVAGHVQWSWTSEGLSACSLLQHTVSPIPKNGPINHGPILSSFHGPWYIFMQESSYCFQRVLAIAILSVCLSVTRVDQSKMVQARITKFSLSAAQKTLVSGTVRLLHTFEEGHPERGR